MGDGHIVSLIDLAGEDKVGTGGAPPSVDLIGVEEAGDGEERGQVDFSGEAAGEPVGEPVEVTEPPSPTGLVWPGTVIGAGDHGG